MKTILSSRCIAQCFISRFNIASILARKMSDSGKIYVRNLAEEDTMKITFNYGTSDRSDRNFTFLRSKQEMLGVALGRLKCKIQSAMIKKVTKKNKKAVALSNDSALPSLEVQLMKNDDVIAEGVQNKDAWTAGTRVKINERIYEVIVNPPTILYVNLPKNIMSGFPVYPKIALEFCKKEDCIFEWFKLLLESDKTQIDQEVNCVAIKNKIWRKVSDSFLYYTGDSDVGCKLRITCLPKYGSDVGIEESAISANDVQPGPGKCPFEDRHQYTTQLTDPGSIRFVSYNILADLYADTDTARNALFPYCPPEVLDIDYRRQLYLKEIMGYNGDIVCMQEVDRRVFQEDLVPVLSYSGLQGVYDAKGGQFAEGLSCFYRASKFKLISSHAVILCDAVKKESVLKRLGEKIVENEKLAERFMSRTTALQIVLLECLDLPGKRILIGNTHLYFHPESDNIRLLQATSCILYLEDLLRQYQKEDSAQSISLFLSGDFNSCPEFGVYKFATEGFLPESCEDWKSNEEEAVIGMDLSHSLNLGSACGTPTYTNYTEGFVGCLDYIFYDMSSFNVCDVVPFPSHEQVVQYKALPNKVFPSDHLALVCTLSWK